MAELPNDPAEDLQRDLRAGTRSALTRWLADRELRKQPVAGRPSYDRCQERDCWGKVSWTCPRCQRKSCSAHRPEHNCAPYLPA